MKKMTLAIMALVLVTVTTAFTWQRNDDAKKEVTTAYFQYELSNTSGENEEENWTKVTQMPGNCLPDGEVLCIIEAPLAADGIHPDFSGFGPGENVRNSELIESISYKE